MTDAASPRTTDDLVKLFNRPERHPPASRLLGFELLDVDAEAGFTRVAFEAKEDFLNPGRTVQGGFLTAMLDEAMSVAAVVHLGPGFWVPTLQMSISFLSAAGPGRLIAEGRVARAGRSALHTRGELFDPDGRLIATATAACVPKRLPGG